MAAIRSDIRNLAEVEEDFLNETGAYSNDLASLDFVSSDGVVLDVRLGPSGWAAEAHHDLEDGEPRGCAFFVGEVEIPVTIRGEVPVNAGEIVCDSPYGWFSLTRLWD